MSEFYEESAQDALELIEEFGAPVELVRSTNSSDPVTGEVTPGTDSPLMTTGILVNYADKVIDGTRILSSDRKLVLTNEQQPLSTDKVRIKSKLWVIKSIKTVEPDGDTPVVYSVQVRK